MKNPIIAFTGLAQSGKTTAANAFISIGFDRMSFADPLKAMVSCLTPCKDKDARPPSLCGKTLREVYFILFRNKIKVLCFFTVLTHESKTEVVASVFGAPPGSQSLRNAAFHVESRASVSPVL